MRTLRGILYSALLLAILTIGVSAQETTATPGEKEDVIVQAPLERPIMDKPMMGGRGMRMGMGRMHMMGPGRMMGPMMFDILSEKLNLSEEQKDKLNDIFVTHRKEMINKKAEREIAQVDLNELIRQDEPDLDAIKAQIKKVSDLDSDMQFLRIKVWIGAKNVLTEEQQASLKELQKERIGRQMSRRGDDKTKKPRMEVRPMRRGR